MSEKRRPYQVWHPGVFVLEEMQARGWSRAEFAEKSGLRITQIAAIVFGEAEVTSDIADSIGKAFGTSAVLWRNLQEAYDRWCASPRSR